MGRSRFLFFLGGAVLLASIGIGVTVVYGNDSRGRRTDYSTNTPSKIHLLVDATKSKTSARSDEDRKTAREFKTRLETARKANTGQRAEVYFRRGPQILDEMMQRDEADEAWATEVTTTAREIFRRPEYRGTTFVNVECRGALCRMTLRHSSEAAFDYFRGRGSNEEPWDGDLIGVHRHLPDGTIEATVYFSDPSGDPGPFRQMREIMEEEQP